VQIFWYLTILKVFSTPKPGYAEEDVMFDESLAITAIIA